MKFKYQGLRGFHPHVVAAVLADPNWLRRRWESEVDNATEQLVAAERAVHRGTELTLREAADVHSLVGDYAEWLLDHVGEDHDEVMWDCDRERDFCEAQLPFESFVEQFQISPDDPTFEDLQAALEKDYPPEEVWEEAAGQGIPLEKVVFCCPHCDNPTTLAFDGSGFSPDTGWYCGVCGLETTFEDDHVEALVNLDVTWWPFRNDPLYDLVRVRIGEVDDDGVHALLREGLNIYPLGEGEALIPVGQLPHALGIRPDIAGATPMGTYAEPPASVVFVRGYVPPMPNDYDPSPVNPVAKGGTLIFPAAMLDHSTDEDDRQAGIFLDNADLRKLHAAIGAYLQGTDVLDDAD